MLQNSNNTSQFVDQDTVRFFVWSVFNFFKSTTEIEPEIGAPYLLDNFKHDDYTGVIGVSGSQKGAVYFTMGKALLDEILRISHPNLFKKEMTEEFFEEIRMDYSGEMANVVSGNVRNYLGEQFLISIPVVVKALNSPMRIQGDVQGIVFPIQWSGHKCHLVLGLKINDSLSGAKSKPF